MAFKYLCVNVRAGFFFYVDYTGSHAVLKVLNYDIGYQDLVKVLSLAKMYKKY